MILLLSYSFSTASTAFLYTRIGVRPDGVREPHRLAIVIGSDVMHESSWANESPCLGLPYSGGNRKTCFCFCIPRNGRVAADG